MEIIVGQNAGFCYGVRNAVTKAEEKLKENGEVYCLGELVHNRQVVNKLESLGLKVIENIEEASNKVIIRAHGIPKETYTDAENLGIEVFDFTCPNVIKIHKIAEEYAKKGYYIFLIGGKKHPENISTISFCGKNSYVIEEEKEISDAICSLDRSSIRKLLIIVQTTFSLEKFERYVEKIKSEIEGKIEIEVRNTICNSTKIRQEETEKISKEVDCMIIIGGKNSSNTRKLYEVAIKNCKNAVIIETKDDLKIEEVKKFKKIGIMAGASTPDESIENVIEDLKK